MSEENPNSTYDNNLNTPSTTSPFFDFWSEYIGEHHPKYEAIVETIGLLQLVTQITAMSEAKRTLVENIGKFLRVCIRGHKISQRKNELESEQDQKVFEFIRIVVSLINDYLKLEFLYEKRYDKQEIKNEQIIEFATNKFSQLKRTKDILLDDRDLQWKRLNSLYESRHAETPNQWFPNMNMCKEPEHMEDVESELQIETSLLNSRNFSDDSNIPVDSESSQSNRNRSESMPADSPPTWFADSIKSIETTDDSLKTINDFEDENVKDENVEDENVKDENVKDENVKDENVEDENVEDENVEDEN
ncbi:4046_t:CDS:1, partial [Ambispora gerdemannii]